MCCVAVRSLVGVLNRGCAVDSQAEATITQMKADAIQSNQEWQAKMTAVENSRRVAESEWQTKLQVLPVRFETVARTIAIVGFSPQRHELWEGDVVPRMLACRHANPLSLCARGTC